MIGFANNSSPDDKHYLLFCSADKGYFYLQNLIESTKSLQTLDVSNVQWCKHLTLQILNIITTRHGSYWFEQQPIARHPAVVPGGEKRLPYGK